MRRATRRQAMLCALAAVAVAGPLAAEAAPSDCASLASHKAPGAALEVESAKETAATDALPAHCLVRGALERRKGVGGVDYAIRFALALPDAWNGRFLFQGGGGLNGRVRPPTGATAAGDRPALARGFAVVSTDSGHEGAVFDGRFLADQEAALNFLYLSVGKVTRAAKGLVAAYYGRPAAHSYFVGCSTGGREAMIASERYPDAFDGIVAGSPAMRTGYSNIGMRWVEVAIDGLSKRDAHGMPIPGTGLTDSDRQLIVDKLVAECDAKDGLADGMIFNAKACKFDPAELTCRGANTSQCLAPAKVAAVERAMSGPVDANGDQVYPGYPYDTGIAAHGPGVLPGVLNGAPSPVDPPVPPTHQDVDKEAIAAATGVEALGYTRAWTNLSSFSSHGGKLLFYHGMSDPWFSANDTIGYYEQLAADGGGSAAIAKWSRLFLVPGMSHCGGGRSLDRFDLLGAVVDWVEHGRAPASVTATGPAFPGRSRPLCPYPAHAEYRGSGDPDDAGNFVCRR